MRNMGGASVIIEKVEIENYRSIKQDSVDFSDLTAIVGKNGVGKSTLLYALDSFYDPGFQYSQFDYYAHITVDTTIRIRVTYSSLRADELVEFGSYVQNGSVHLELTRVWG
jgi:predicted ATP-dependent endonuclease of OLD family